MERHSMKRAGEKLDSNRPTKKRRLDDYRRDAGLIPNAPQAPQETLETPHTFKMAWAVDQARFKLDRIQETRNSDSFLSDAKKHFDNLAEVIKERDLETFNNILDELKSEKETDKYIREGMNAYEEAIKKAYRETTEYTEQAEDKMDVDYTEQTEDRMDTN